MARNNGDRDRHSDWSVIAAADKFGLAPPHGWTMFRICGLVCVSLVCVVACESRECQPTYRDPAWADPVPGVAYDEPTRLPKEVIDRGTRIRMVLVPAGVFTMGIPGDHPNSNDYDDHAHTVRITKPFYIGKYEVTQEQWNQNTTIRNSEDLEGKNRPIRWASWDDVQVFLSRTGFRLPSEAEWEYACRAGTTGERYGPIDKIACYGENFTGPPDPVARSG